MGEGFRVHLPVITAIAGDVDQLATASRKASHYSDRYLTHQWDGGGWFVNAGSTIDLLRDQTVTGYREFGHSLEQASERFIQLRKDFADTDADQRRALDKLIRDDGKVYDPTDVYPDFATTDAGIRQVDVDAVLSDPGNAESGFVDTFYDIEGKIDNIISLGHEADAVTQLGFSNPFVGWADEWKGHWGEMGVASAALARLGEFWIRFAGEARATRTRFPGQWTGHTADAGLMWLDQVADRCLYHGTTMTDFGDEVLAKAIAMNECITPLLDLGADLVDTATNAVALAAEVGGISDIFDLVSHPLSIFSKTYGVAKDFAGLVEKVVGLIKHVGKIISIARIAGSALYSIYRDWNSNVGSNIVQAPYVHSLLPPSQVRHAH